MHTVSRRLVLRGAAFAIAAGATPQVANAVRDNAFVSADSIPLLDLLLPPPAQDSATTKFELEEIVKVQAAASAERKRRAIADDKSSLVQFLAGMDLPVGREDIALSARLFARATASANNIVATAKDAFKRPRPSLLERQIEPLISLPDNGAYPSGHSANGSIIGIVLAKMLPEKKAAVFARVRGYAWSRVVVGVHYRSDLEAGFTTGSLIANAMLHSNGFQHDFEPAKAELRRALGMA